MIRRADQPGARADPDILIQNHALKLRAITDFEHEMQMAQTNRILDPTIDTMFFTTSLRYAYVSSTIVKEVAHYDNTDISKFVNPYVAARLKEKLGR